MSDEIKKKNMEPVTTAAMIGAIVGHLAETIKANKSVKDFLNDFTDATVQWIRPLFLKDDNHYEKVIEDLMKNPDSAIKQQQVEVALASHLEDKPENEVQLKALYEQLQEKVRLDKSPNVINYITQNHSGTGDNVGRDKIIGK